MPSAPEFHPYVGSLGGATRRGSGGRIVLIASFIGALTGGGIVWALMPAPSAEKPALSKPVAAGGMTSATDGAAPASVGMATPDARKQAPAKSATNTVAEDVSAAQSSDKTQAQPVWPNRETRGVRVVAPDAPGKTNELAGGPAELAAQSAPASAGTETVRAEGPVPPLPTPESKPALTESKPAPAETKPALAETKPAASMREQQPGVRSADADDEVKKPAEPRPDAAARQKKSRAESAARSRRFEEADARSRHFADDQQERRMLRRWIERDASERDVAVPDGRRPRALIVNRGIVPRDYPREIYRDADPRPVFRSGRPREFYSGTDGGSGSGSDGGGSVGSGTDGGGGGSDGGGGGVGG